MGVSQIIQKEIDNIFELIDEKYEIVNKKLNLIEEFKKQKDFQKNDELKIAVIDMEDEIEMIDYEIDELYGKISDLKAA